MDHAAILEQLNTRWPTLIAVYGFGSCFQGTGNEASDLDLAVLIEGKADPVALWRQAGDLEDLAGRPVDLVDLRAATTVMQYQIITTGQRLWAKDERAGIYESFILSEKTALDEARGPLLDRVLREGKVYG